MSCKEMETKLVSYTDGRATEAERATVESHLESCAGCRARVAEFRAVWSVLDDAPVPQPSPSFDARLRQRIAAEPRRTWSGGLVLSPRLALATVALALLSVWVASGPGPQPPLELGQGTDSQEMRDLEDYDVLADFDALSALPPAPADKKQM